MSTLSDHEAPMREALALAHEAAAAGEVPVGAVLLHEGRIIGRGRNRREQLTDPTAHAELLALREGAQALGDWRLPNTTLYVTLEPCPMCAGAIAMARVGLTVFGAYDQRMGCTGSHYDLPADAAFGKPLPALGGILGEECARLLADFFAKRRSIQPTASTE